MVGAALLPSSAELAVFASAVFVLNATPGVDFVLTVSRSLQAGARAGAAAAAGITAGCVVHALAAAFGLAALLALYPTAFLFIQWAGAAYLVWLGLGLLKAAWLDQSGPAAHSAAGGPEWPLRSLMADFRAGLLTNVLNPKVALFFLAFLPQFVPADTPSKTLSFLLLGGWFVLQGFVFLMLLVWLASRWSHLGASAPVRRGLNTMGGLLFIALAMRLLREKPGVAA